VNVSSAAESIRVSSTTLTQSAQKATEFGEIKQPLSLLRRCREFTFAKNVGDVFLDTVYFG